jgi:hypothetical protein
MKKISHNAGMV